jgi:hypothetical protein
MAELAATMLKGSKRRSPVRVRFGVDIDLGDLICRLLTEEPQKVDRKRAGKNSG